MKIPLGKSRVGNLLALYQFCADYHSGQWSRGYRLLCVVENALKRRKIGGDYLSKAHIRAANVKLYNWLVKHYANKV